MPNGIEFLEKFMKAHANYLLLLIGLTAAAHSSADDLGVKVILEKEVSPGVYGRVELSNNSHPDVYYAEPVVIIKDSQAPRYRPVYLHVPPGHAKHWGKHCHKYNACGRPVYFIRSVEYAEYDGEHHHDRHDHDHKHPGKPKGKKEKHHHKH